MTASGASRALQAILSAGLVVGVLDGLAASAVTLSFGNRVPTMFQYIASAVLGPQAFSGGAATVVLGVVLHFLVALSAAAVYYVASRGLSVLVERPLVSGVLYGVLVHLVMALVVVPMTAIGRRPINLRSFVIILIVHMIVVGPPIALIVRRYSR